MTLEETAAQKRREYYRAWRQKNPDKVREKNRRYWLKKAQEAMESEKKGVEE